jgi:hypothetical protein
MHFWQKRFFTSPVFGATFSQRKSLTFSFGECASGNKSGGLSLALETVQVNPSKSLG